MEIHIHFVSMWGTTEGKIHLTTWPRAAKMFIVLLRKHPHQVNSADCTLFKCFCIEFTLLQPIDYDCFLNVKIKFDACWHPCISTIILVFFFLFYRVRNYQVIYICISAGNQLAVSLMIPAHLWKRQGTRDYMCSGKRDQREHKDSELFVDAANGNKAHSSFYIILWQEMVGWKINLRNFAWVLFPLPKLCWNCTTGLDTHRHLSVCFTNWGSFSFCLYFLRCSQWHVSIFTFFFCNLYPLYNFFCHKATRDTIRHATWFQSVEDRLSVTTAPVATLNPTKDIWMAPEGQLSAELWPSAPGNAGTLRCQICRMDPTAQDKLWRATEDIFSSTFAFIYTSWRMEFQHDPIKSKMLFQRLGYLFADLNHTSACEMHTPLSGQIPSKEFILSFNHSLDILVTEVLCMTLSVEFLAMASFQLLFSFHLRVSDDYSPFSHHVFLFSASSFEVGLAGIFSCKTTSEGGETVKIILPLLQSST